MRTLFATTALALLASPLIAGDAALILGNDRYDDLPRASGGEANEGAANALAEAGFGVTVATSADAATLTEAFSAFLSELDESTERVVVMLSGQFATSGHESWLLGTDAAEEPTLATVTGLPVSSLLAVLEEYPGKALLVLSPGRDGDALGPHLDYGVSMPDLPQGVTLLTGDAGDAATILSRAFARPDEGLLDAATRADLAVSGYAPAGWTLAMAAPAPTPVTQPQLPRPSAAEPVLWSQAQERDTIAAYEAYLAEYPDGANAATARAMIREINTEPNRDARKAEEALALSRDARREIQRDLSLLDYNTRGIDGIFGPGTRGAIQSWQAANAFAATSYLTQNQILRLDAQAERRAIELEEEAQRRRAQQEQQDRAYWDETGAAGDEPGLRAYLGRYPDGLFADVAQERLAVIEERQRARAERQDRVAWDQARDVNSVAGYRAYLDRFPQGAFAGEAQARIDAATRSEEDRAANEQAQREENALGLNAVTRRLVEQRLAQLDLDPGAVDGTFDDNTRRALRRYQQARNLPDTGYLNEATVVRLLADAILR
ncbi:peptidoglycan-binding domain-containing protein [Mesobacterium pallidum]|uniref:peptidoglycan-binding domain-containing protein n=1 Tax=Mesobacterium pallidum TaxID=2872037 RepID=UPI001EE264A7|nr:peptidoglycan-binding domain-containing protein [Mesobacterium pallidum]